MALTADQAIKRVEALYSELKKRRPKIEKRQSYFDGDQPLCYASDEFKRYHGQRFAGFSDNWCGVVGSAAPELTEFAGIHLGDDADDLSDDERSLLRDWNVNNGQSKSSQGYLSGAVTSRSFALVWGDQNEEPVLTWEHSSQAIVDYVDGTDTPVAGLKAWVEDQTEFATLYMSDAVWKFERPTVRHGRTESGIVLPRSFGLESGWKQRQPSTDDRWPIPNPLGVVPLVEFPNRPVLGSGPISDIEGTMAMQDAINLMWAYLFGAADHATMPARVIMGAEPPKMPILNEDGVKVGEKALDLEELARGKMLWLTGQASIGQWDAAKLDVFTGVVDVMIKHVAAQTKTPINYMGALSNVNGETLDGLRIPLHMKVRDGWKHLEGPHREVFRRFALVRGNDAVAEACRSAVINFKNPETASDAQTSDAALKDKQIGWSAAGILERRYGMSQQEIDKELQRREVEAESDPAVTAARDLMNGGASAPVVGQ